MASLTDYHDVRYEPGDVLLWGGTNWQSRLIQLGTCSWKQLWRGQWISHIGIIGHYGVYPLHWESTTLCPLPCVAQGKVVNGVQCHDPYKEIADYDGRVWVLKMRRPLKRWQQDKLAELLLGYLGKSYDTSSALIAGTTWLKRLADPDPADQFCSELVGMVLIDMDLGIVGFNPSTITPARLALKLVNDFKYKPAVRIK